MKLWVPSPENRRPSGAYTLRLQSALAATLRRSFTTFSKASGVAIAAILALVSPSPAPNSQTHCRARDLKVPWQFACPLIAP